ncbi:phosphodiester glycosidase family protein [Sphaerospermopsis aphanizomenoides BCCUSP55]|uniref:phosphodiester glycosidase family protein n=1 Tax=Sphaerospermopsis aphanizomenoides TaxID=459663 RepID=UPI0019039DB0|nr:phosphodiester glycosidase family protein [Sphaerospermopsis aphanizomenoides]MBK1989933.1 phosphodiester glycosidase family protein [Sphaerospermopsis aphanizomenoides BCCUSP55]
MPMIIINQRKFFRSSVLSILSIAMCLTATCTANAQQPPKNFPTLPTLKSPSPTPSSGNQITLNGRTLAGAWVQQQGTSGTAITHLSDGALRQFIGVDLLNTNNPALQPVEWFSATPTLNAKLLGGYRYLDISSFAQTYGWQMQANGNTLVISTPATKINNIRQGKRPHGERLVIDLDRPTPWKLTQGQPIKRPVDPNAPTSQPSIPPNREWIITLDSTADNSLIQRYTPQPPISPPNQSKQLPSSPNPETLIQKVEMVSNQTNIRLSVPFGSSPQIITLANPHRLVVDIRPDALVAKDINWATGLRWQQKFINVGKDSFPVVWLEINPRVVGLTLRPIWANLETQTGTAPLIQTAQRYLAVAGINGGYFNRNNKLPLGAIKRDHQWVSGPILNRGAIAWNDAGEFYFGRLTLNETLINNNNQSFPILFLNSGYVQNGIARYTPTWGSNYTPLSDNEIILIVQQDQITNQLPGGKVGVTPIPIPQNGYLLTLRGTATTNASKLPIGTKVSISSSTTPADFNRYPHIIGAGPLLVQNRQIVLDAQGEKFSNAFIAEKAVRSAICTTNTGNLMIAAVHNRAGGHGPTLAEHAQLMKVMGCVNALNLDGGSSTSLYLGGQLLDRSPNTAARVHNGIGIFLQSP